MNFIQQFRNLREFINDHNSTFPIIFMHLIE